jgi:hypothetical protein
MEVIILLTKEFIESIDLSTRSKRCDVIAHMTELLGKIKFTEEVYLLLYPLEKQDDCAYIAAENSAEAIEKAMGNLKNAY